MKNYHNSHRIKVEMHIALYSGLLFILFGLLFLTMMFERSCNANLHSANASLRTSHINVNTPLVTLSIEPGERYYLSTGMQPKGAIPLVNLQKDLTQYFKSIDRQHLTIWIKSESTVQYSQLMKVVTALYAIGIKHIGLVTHTFPQSSH